MNENLKLIVAALDGKCRVNESNNSVELFDEHGVKMRLSNLDGNTLAAFKENFPSFQTEIAERG